MKLRNLLHPGSLKPFPLLMLLLACGFTSKAQNIKEDVIYVGTESITEILFNAEIEKTNMPEGDGSFEVLVSGNNKSITVTSLKKTAKPQPLLVKEGPREHKFMLTYKQGVPPGRIDWSDLKALEAHVGQPATGGGDKAAESAGAKKGPAISFKREKKKADEKKAPEESASQKSQNELNEANNLYKQERWAEAKVKYEKVLAANPETADFVQFRLEEIKKKQLEAEKKEQEKKYADAMARGNHFFGLKNYTAAHAAFKEAGEAKPADGEAQNKLQLADKKLAEEKDRKYSEAMAKGGSLFNQKKFGEAKAAYDEALALRPADTDARNKLLLVDKKLAVEKAEGEKKEKENQFGRYVHKGDSLLAAGSPEDAKASYEEALKMKPGDAGLLKKVDDLKKRGQQEAYRQWVTKGDQALQAKNTGGARQAYNQALLLDPRNPYPKAQLAKIDQLQKDQVRNEKEDKMEKDKKANYQAAVDLADRAFKSANYDLAIEEYGRASRIFRDSLYPANQVKQIHKLRSAPPAQPVKNAPGSSIKPAAIQEQKKENAAPAAVRTPAPEPKPSFTSALTQVVSATPAEENKPEARVPATDPFQKDPIPFSPEELKLRYPSYDFSRNPPDQAMNLVDDAKDHYGSIRDALALKPELAIRDSNNNVTLICQNISFSGSNTYLKLLIRNEDPRDFLAGAMLLSWKQKFGKLIPQRAVSISDHPVVLPGKERTVVYVTRVPNITDEESLYFELSDRPRKRKLQLTIPGKVFNEARNR